MAARIKHIKQMKKILEFFSHTQNTLSSLSQFYVSLAFCLLLSTSLCHYKHTAHTTVNCDKTSPMLATVLEVLGITALCMSLKKKENTLFVLIIK